MLTKVQAYIVGGCLLVGILFVIIYESWPLLSGRASIQIGPAGGESTEARDKDRVARARSANRRPLPETPLPDGCYKITVETFNTAKYQEREERFDGGMALTYAHRAVPGGIVVTFYSLEVTSLKDGRIEDRFFVSHDKSVEQSGSRVIEWSRDEVSPEQRDKMDAGFATNHTKILLDDDRNETGRDKLSPMGWQVVNEGLLNTTRLVHGPYFRATNSWTSSRRIPMTMGRILDCPVRYTKAAEVEGKVTVNGSLAKEEVRSPAGGPTLRNVSLRLAGEEFFDRDVGDYTSGKLDLSYRFDVDEEGEPLVKLSGAMTLTLERLKTGR